MTTTLQNNVALLNARSGIYTAWQIRNFQDGDPPGPGVADYESFRVKQRVAGLAYSVDIGLAGALNQAWIRGTSRDGQGLYRCDNIDYTAPLVNTFLAQFNEAGFAAADPTNPRVDQVFLRVLDQQHDGGASNLLQTTVVTGTPSAPVTLDNRTGVGAVPANSILLADVLITAAATSIPTANIRDRRQFPLPGTVPPIPLSSGAAPIDQVIFQPCAGLVISPLAIAQPTFDSMQGAALMYLPRRIVNATKIRFATIQGATPAATQFNIAICDASGRLIQATGAQSFLGGANARNGYPLTIPATTFEPGWYWVWMGLAPMTAASSLVFFGVGFNITVAGNVGVPSGVMALRSAAGGITFPASNTLLGMTNIDTIAAATTSLPVPIIALSVG